MKSYKPLVEKRDAGRRLGSAGKRRPIDAVDTFEQNAARAGIAAAELDPGTRPIAQASQLVRAVLDHGFAAYFAASDPGARPEDAPVSAARFASEGLRLAKRPDAADIIDRAIAIAGGPPQAEAAFQELDSAFFRADDRAALHDALNDYLVDNPQLFEITEDDLDTAWNTRQAQVSPATGRLPDLPDPAGARLRSLASKAGLPIREMRFAPLANGTFRLEQGETRLQAKRAPSEHPRGGPTLDGWVLTDASTGEILATDPDPVEPDPAETAAIIEDLALNSHGLPASRVRELMSGNPVTAFLTLRFRRLFAPKAFYQLQLAAGEVMPGLHLAQNAFLNGLFVAFLLAFLLPLSLGALPIAASHLPGPLGFVLLFLLALSALYILAQSATYAIAQTARLKGWRLRDQPPRRFAPTPDLSDYFAY